MTVVALTPGFRGIGPGAGVDTRRFADPIVLWLQCRDGGNLPGQQLQRVRIEFSRILVRGLLRNGLLSRQVNADQYPIIGPEYRNSDRLVLLIGVWILAAIGQSRYAGISALVLLPLLAAAVLPPLPTQHARQVAAAQPLQNGLLLVGRQPLKSLHGTGQVALLRDRIDPCTQQHQRGPDGKRRDPP